MYLSVIQYLNYKVSIHKAYMMPTYCLHKRHANDVFLGFLQGGRTIREPFLQVVSLILAGKFSREFWFELRSKGCGE